MRSLKASIMLTVAALPALGAEEGLFTPVDLADAAHVSPASVSEGSAATGQRWLVRVDWGRLFSTVRTVEQSGFGRLLLNVAQGLELEVAVERTRRTLSGYSLSGRVVGTAGSAVTLVVHAEAIMGSIWTLGGTYEVAPLKDGVHVVRKVDPSARRPLGEPIRAEGGWGSFPPVEQANEDDGNVVDVLVLWTPKALENIGDEAQMRMSVDHSVAWANDAYERSGAKVRLNLVGAEPVDYVEEGEGCTRLGCRSGTDLDRLANPSDGFMDGAHGRRDALGADLVSLFTGDGDVGGIANLPGPFSVVLANQHWSGHGSTFAHELGHNMGLSHDRYQDTAGLLPFSYGYVNKLAFEPGAAEGDCWLTIMSYSGRCFDSGFERVSGVPYFSTPNLRHPDYAEALLGVPKSSDEEGPDGPADAVYALNLRTHQVASFRPGRTDDGGTPQTATPVVATSTTFARLADSDDVDYFRIELPEAGWLRVETTTTGSGNLRGALIAADGELIVKDNDSGEGYNFLILEDLQAGVYFIRVEDQDWDTPDDYALIVSFNPTSTADDHGAGKARATTAATPSSTAGELQFPSDTDWFRFEVAERGVVRVGTAGETDVIGELASEDGAIRLTDDDGGPGLNFLFVAKLDPGTYFVSVRGFGGKATGPYSLDISFSPLSAEPDDHADVLAGATRIAVGASASGELEVSLDRDHFRIWVPGPGPGQLWVESQGDTDVEGALLRRDGELVSETGLGGEHPNFIIGAQVVPGTYFLRVAGENASNAGPYELQVSFTADSRAIPLFLSASHPSRQGFARIINRDSRHGTVAIHAIDDAGERRGPVTLSLAARQTAHFNSEDLEAGNAAKGLSGGVGSGEGDWRLELATDLDIEVLAYVRTADGFLTGMNDVVTSHREYREHGYKEIAAIFNPASNRTQVSRLRLINTGPSWQAAVFLRGHDDRGEIGNNTVFLWLGAGASRTFTAQSLEAGNDDFWEGGLWEGRLGYGYGKWRLHITSFLPTRAMSLLESPTGHLANLSGRAAVGMHVSLPLLISASNSSQQGFIRIINREGREGEVAIHAIDDAGQRRGPVRLSLNAMHAAHFNADDLEMGNRAKGLSGSLGAGTGDWRLEFFADMAIEALAYVRTTDGFLTGMNAVVPQARGRHEVVFFNPASNNRQVSRLRLINPSNAPATISISGLDDAGNPPPEGEVGLTLPSGAATAITAQQLEAGAAHLEGRFGDGKGKWRLFIEADQDIQAMSLIESPTGHISNLSAGTAVR